MPKSVQYRLEKLYRRIDRECDSFFSVQTHATVLIAHAIIYLADTVKEGLSDARAECKGSCKSTE